MTATTPPAAMPDADVVAEARTWLGVPWVHQGRSRDGVDCAGLPCKVARATRGYTFDIANYAAQAKDETMLALCAQHMQGVPLTALRPGLVVVMRYQNQRHMGILSTTPHTHDDGTPVLGIVHASSKFGKVVEHRLDGVHRRLCIAAFALRDLRDLRAPAEQGRAA